MRSDDSSAKPARSECPGIDNPCRSPEGGGGGVKLERSADGGGGGQLGRSLGAGGGQLCRSGDGGIQLVRSVVATGGGGVVRRSKGPIPRSAWYVSTTLPKFTTIVTSLTRMFIRFLPTFRWRFALRKMGTRAEYFALHLTRWVKICRDLRRTFPWALPLLDSIPRFRRPDRRNNRGYRLPLVGDFPTNQFHQRVICCSPRRFRH